jgi:hypothetical protein
MREKFNKICSSVINLFLKMIPTRLRKSPKMVEIEVDIPAETYAELVLAAQREGITVDELATRIVSDFIKRYDANE